MPGDGRRRKLPPACREALLALLKLLHLQLEVEREEMVSAEQLKKSSCLEAAGAGGQLEPLACSVHSHCPSLGWEPRGSGQEQIGFSDRKRGMQNARRNFD